MKTKCIFAIFLLFTACVSVRASNGTEGNRNDNKARKISGNTKNVAKEIELIKEEWDYVKAMKKIAKKFKGKDGVVCHFGDSITRSEVYGRWPLKGKVKSKSDKAILEWMHCGEKNEFDGWYLATENKLPPELPRTAFGGIRADGFLAGGGHRNNLSLANMLKKYNPQIAVVMLGTNGGEKEVNAYKATMEKVINLILANGTVCVLSTIPPHFRRKRQGEEYNDVLKKLGKKYKLPMIDYYSQITNLAPNGSWNGTIMQKNNVHPSAGSWKDISKPLDQETFKNNGYFLRSWLTVQKIKEVKKNVLTASRKSR